MAPETFNFENIVKIYMFGIIILEIFIDFKTEMEKIKTILEIKK